MDNKAILEKAIDGYESIYAINKSGDVISLKYGYNLKKYLDRKGYWRVSLNKKVDGKWKSQQVLVHRLLALAFIANPNNLPYINHKNGVRSDNALNNLEWCTASYNVQDGFNRGRVAWNKELKSTANMDLHDLARELPRLQEIAKALWGEREVERVEHPEDGVTRTYYKGRSWQQHLQQIVIAEDPIAYLGENI